MKRKKLPKSLALFLAACMTFSTAGSLISASEAEVAVDEQVLQEEPETEIQTVAEAPAAEEPIPEPPVVEEPIPEEPVVEKPIPEEPVVEEPTPEPPVTEEPTPEPPVTEEPTPEPPVTEEPTPEPPAIEKPIPDPPVTEEPTPEPPVTEEPTPEPPVIEEPAPEPPVTEEPTPEPPAAEEPTPEPPVTGEPTPEPPAAEAEKIEYRVTFDSHAADYGKIVVDNQPVDISTYEKKIIEKESFTFSVVPAEGYETEYVRVDGIDVPGTEQQGEYRITAVEKDTVVTVAYREIPEVENLVTFQANEGAAIFTQDGVQITSSAVAKNGRIVFSIIGKEGYTVTEVLVDGYIPARHTGNPNEYIIEGICTDETIVTVSTAPIETGEDAGSEADGTEEAAKEEENTSEAAGSTAQVNGGEEQHDVEVRASADGLSEILFTLPHGAYVTVLGTEGDWLKIEYEGQAGYVYKASVFSGEAEMPEAEKQQPKATIFSSRSAVMEPGEAVTLTSRLEHADGYEIRYQWECDRGNGFEAIEGANSDTYTFEADAQTLSYNWRLVIYYR